jgi:hypothetical protein
MESVHNEIRQPSRAGSDIFWDALEQNATDFQTDNSLLSFADIASTADSGYWTDSDLTGPISWSSCGNYPAFPDSPLDKTLFPMVVKDGEIVEPSAGQQEYTNMFDTADPNPPTISDEAPHQSYTALLAESPAHGLPEPSPHKSEDQLLGIDDPFMGSWTSEKAHRPIDDYGWVLYHVENL